MPFLRPLLSMNSLAVILQSSQAAYKLSQFSGKLIFFRPVEAVIAERISKVLLSNRDAYTSMITLSASSLAAGLSNICVAG